MRKVQFERSFLCALAFVLVVYIISCNQKTTESKTGGYKITDSTNFTDRVIPCYTLSYQDLELWEEKDLLSQISYVLFLPDRDEDPSRIKVTLFPFSSSNTILVDGILTLYNKSSCNGLTDEVLLAENYLPISDMGIVQNGNFIKFNSITLHPYARESDKALGFNYTVEGSTSPLEAVLNPCPPCVYCIPRCIEDSIPNGDTTLRLNQLNNN